MPRPPIDQQVTFLYTRRLEETNHFYHTVLGLPLVLDQGSCRIYQVSDTAFIGFCERETAPDQPQGIIFTLVSQDVDGWYSYLQAQNIPIEKPPTLYEAYNIYHLFLRDPNGYLLEIQRFLDPAWPG